LILGNKYNQKFPLIYDEWKFFFDGHCCPVQKSDQALSMQDKKPPIKDGWFFMFKKTSRKKRLRTQSIS